MDKIHKPTIAIIDFGMGNLFSVKNACEAVGLNACITSSKEDIFNADGLILPGVGAFGKAMARLKELGLMDLIRKEIASGKPFMGICLGMQLLMSESSEFGTHEGLDIIKGKVVRFENKETDSLNLIKVPHIGWNCIDSYEQSKLTWSKSMLSGLENGTFMYFIHSYYVMPEDNEIIISVTDYGNCRFCSSLEYNNIFVCQFHPEKSTDQGIQIYENWAQKYWNITSHQSDGKELSNAV